ncbi:MAG: TPM domain-containing protein, partial [Bacteroidales bacterium]|nr:TPM domain-containing protein [Bacteroidales bacterium]
MLQEQFTAEQKTFVVNAIKQAELNTSGEIRVHIESKSKESVLDRAADVFAMLKMHLTEQRNGVLFYLATGDKQFAILGDAGINEKVPNDFWETIKDMMQQHFKNVEFALGLAKGIEMAGEKLKEFFPYK